MTSSPSHPWPSRLHDHLILPSRPSRLHGHLILPPVATSSSHPWPSHPPIMAASSSHHGRLILPPVAVSSSHHGRLILLAVRAPAHHKPRRSRTVLRRVPHAHPAYGRCVSLTEAVKYGARLHAVRTTGHPSTEPPAVCRDALGAAPARMPSEQRALVPSESLESLASAAPPSDLPADLPAPEPHDDHEAVNGCGGGRVAGLSAAMPQVEQRI
jgi:hypothetical protein